MISISLKGRVSDFVKEQAGPWKIKSLLDKVVEMKMVTPEKPALPDTNTCPT